MSKVMMYTAAHRVQIVHYQALAAMIESSYQTAQTVRELINTSGWTGDHVNHIAAMLEMTLSYHQKLSPILEDIISLLTLFTQHYDRITTQPMYRKLVGVIHE